MPSPHTLGSIMHQPLAALTPLLLFPLENRTSTQHARAPPAPSLLYPVAPASVLPLDAVSLAFVRQSSTAGTIPAAFVILRIPSLFCIGKGGGGEGEGEVDSHPFRLARTISATPSRRRSSSRCFRLSRSIFPFSPPIPSLCLSLSLFPLPQFHSSLARSSERGYFCLCRDFRLFLPFAPRRRRRHRRSGAPLSGVCTLFVVSSPLSVLLRPARFTIALSIPRTIAHTLPNILTQRHLSCVSFSPIILRGPPSFLNSIPSICASRSSSSRGTSLSPLLRESSLPDAPNLPP